MAFPKTFLGFPKGWDDRGAVGSTYDSKDGTYITLSHRFCKTTAHIGIENNGEVFRFCPKCMVKLIETNDTKKT